MRDMCLTLIDPIIDFPYSLNFNDGMHYYKCSFEYEKTERNHVLGVGDVENVGIFYVKER